MGRSRRGGWLLACGLCVLLVVSGVASTAAAPSDDGLSSQPALEPPSLQQADETNNSTDYHENPDTVDEEGDSEDVASWLRSELGSRLGDSTLQLSNGEYELAKSIIGDEYTDSLGKLVDVAGDTDSGDGDDGGDGGDGGGSEEVTALNQTRNLQQEFIEEVESFRETRQTYEAVKQSGNETRARVIARDLQSQATSVDELSRRLLNEYQTVANTTGLSVASSVARIQAVASNVTETRETIVVAEFIRTNVSVSRTAENASFTDPVTLQGRLRTATTSGPSPNGTVTVRVGERTFEPTVTSSGQFTIQYRPVTEPTGPQQIDVRYAPRPDSVFLGSTANTTVTITPVTPSVSVAVANDRLRFGDEATVTGRVAVNGTGVPGLPLDVELGSVTAGTVETGPGGRFQYTSSLPATVPTGSQPVDATVALDGRAISSATGTDGVTVLQTNTSLSISGEWREETVAVDGQLTTSDGVPVPDQTVQVLRNGTRLAAAQTDSEGRYATTLAPVAASSENQSLNVTAVYAIEDGNLANSTASVRLEPPVLNGDAGSGGNGADDSAGRSLTRQLRDDGSWLLLGAGLLIGVGGVYWWGRRKFAPTGETADESAPTPVEPETEATEADIEDDASSAPLAPATDALEADDDPDRAVRLAYSTVRQALSESSVDDDSLPGAEPVTHWEFHRAYADTVDGDDLRALTTAYERAKYAPERSTPDNAADAIDAAERLLDDLDGDRV